MDTPSRREEASEKAPAPRDAVTPAPKPLEAAQLEVDTLRALFPASQQPPVHRIND